MEQTKMEMIVGNVENLTNRFSCFTMPREIVGPHLKRPVSGFLVFLISERGLLGKMQKARTTNELKLFN